MTITNGYATLVEVKDADALNFTTTAHDTFLENIIEAVSREFDNYLERRFYSASETRYYTAERGNILFVDDISTASGFLLYTDNDGDRTYENTWAATDYDLLPFNAVTGGFPFNYIQTTPNGAYSFPGTSKGVKITATFGWAAVPKTINRACVLQSKRLFKRYEAVFGVQGSTAFGTTTVTMPGIDPDVCMLIDPYRTFLP